MEDYPIRPIQIVSKKYDGTLRERYVGHLLEQVGSLIRVQVFAGTPIYRGIDRTRSLTYNAIEIYFTDCWYNVWHFPTHGIDRYLWYANIAMPARLDGSILQWIDLDIDVCCHMDGSIETLDYDEFLENRSTMHYPKDIVERALAAHDEVIHLAKSSVFPFNRTAQLRHWAKIP